MENAPMTRERLVAFLDGEGVHRTAYCLDGGHPDETYRLDQRGYEWVVYFSGRGLERSITSFGSESDALDYLLHLVIKDPTTRRY